MPTCGYHIEEESWPSGSVDFKFQLNYRKVLGELQMGKMFIALPSLCLCYKARPWPRDRLKGLVSRSFTSKSIVSVLLYTVNMSVAFRTRSSIFLYRGARAGLPFLSA